MFLRKDNSATDDSFFASIAIAVFCLLSGLSSFLPTYSSSLSYDRRFIEPQTKEDVGLLVQVSFYITAFTLPAYRRGSLPRPSKDDSS